MGRCGIIVVCLLDGLKELLGLIVEDASLLGVLGGEESLFQAGFGQLEAHAVALGCVEIIGVNDKPILTSPANVGGGFLRIGVACQCLQPEIAGQPLGRFGVLALLGNDLAEDLTGRSGIFVFQITTAQPGTRLPADRVLVVAPGKLLQRNDRLLEKIAAPGDVGAIGIGLGLIEQVDAKLQLGLEPGLGQRLLLG